MIRSVFRFVFLVLPIVALCQVLLTGCATTAYQTEKFLESPPAELPRSVKIENVPFIEQAANHCGPSTLAMATAWAGSAVPLDQLTKQVYTPGAKGTYQADMISAARRNGFLAIPIAGLAALMTELASQHPVIVFENLAFNWYPQWHYALAFGYDLEKEDIILHSGPVKEKHWDLRKFERSWMLGDYWGLVVLPPGQLSASADDLAHTTAASALEAAGHGASAKKVYESVLEKWPSSLSALIALANITYAAGETNQAAELLGRATVAHPDSAAAWHNLAIAQHEMKQEKLARASAEKAMQFSTPSQKISYTKSLQEILAPVR